MESGQTAVSVSMLRYVLRRRLAEPPEAGFRNAVLATVEVPQFVFTWRSSHGEVRAARFGRLVPVRRNLPPSYFMLSELPYRGTANPNRVLWVDGRRTEDGCGVASCGACPALAARGIEQAAQLPAAA
jgi:hypothetical protein